MLKIFETNPVKKMKYYLFMLILLFPVLSYSNEETEKLSFIIFNLKTNNCPIALGTQFSTIIKNRIVEENSFQLKDPASPLSGDFNEATCINSDCSPEMKKIYSDGIVIVGTITRTEFKTGERPISKYAVEVLKTDTYLLNLFVINMQDTAYDFTYEQEFFNNQDLMTKADEIAQEIKKYYVNKKIVKPLVAEKKKERSKSQFGYSIAGISVSPSILLPFGKYLNMIKYGYGLDVDLKGIILPYASIFITPKLGFYNLQESRENIKSGQMLSLYINAGCSFQVYKYVTLSPYIGIGYVFQFIYGDKNAVQPDANGNYTFKQEFYYNPSMDLGLDLAYSISEKYQVVISPAYRFFADHKSISSFALLNLGMRLNF